MKIKASDYIAKFLRAHEIHHVYEVAGGMITHILDSLHKDGYVNVISVHHEQCGAFAADAYGRRTGKPGVSLATSGPGATNLLTGIASCYFDSSPALFITGQVNIHEQKGDLKIRQLGFQETDIVSMAEPITKKCYRVKDANQIPTILTEAYEIAMSGRRGPVLIDIPMNLQRMEIDAGPIATYQKIRNAAFSGTDILNTLHRAINHSQKPLILAGGGINSSEASKEFLEFINLVQIPVVTSLQAVDTIPFEHPLRVGFIGSYGNRWANLSLSEADFILVIGSRLDIRQTGTDVEGFKKGKIIFHLDCDSGEINNRVKGCLPILADIKNFLSAANKSYKYLSFNKREKWLDVINQLKQSWPDIKELKNQLNLNPNTFMHTLSSASRKAAGYTVDVGSHQMWAAQSLEIAPNQFFMTSGGLGSMGFALPAAVGASFAHGKGTVVTIAGDGGFQMNIQELQTIVRNKLPIKIVVLNNNSLGMIRQFQDSYFAGRHQSTQWGYSAPNFELIAKAYGIEATTIDKEDQIQSGLKYLWQNEQSPALLQVMIEPSINVYPKIAFGKPISQMEPFALPVEMEGT